MQTVKQKLDQLKWDKTLKINKKDIKIWYWDNIYKKLIPISWETYLNSENDNEFIRFKDDTVIPFHRILRITVKNKSIWERKTKLTLLSRNH